MTGERIVQRHVKPAFAIRGPSPRWTFGHGSRKEKSDVPDVASRASLGGRAMVQYRSASRPAIAARQGDRAGGVPDAVPRLRVARAAAGGAGARDIPRGSRGGGRLA